MVPLTDPARHAEFLEGLKASIDMARRLGAPVLIAQTGTTFPDGPAPSSATRSSACLANAADVLKGSGVVLAIEPLNTRVDHKGYFLSSTAEGLDIVDEVGRPEMKIVYDIYHSAVMGEEIADVLAGRLDRVAHVHLADRPGRHEPGRARWTGSAGSIGWPQTDTPA